jgi:acetate kinase
MQILVVNTGSSSLKLRLLRDGQVERDRHVEGWDGQDVEPVSQLMTDVPTGSLDAVGHRVVHGGTSFRAATPIDDDMERRLRELVPLAPLHQERALAGIAAARAVLPDVPHVACFDTAYHATLPAAAATYALPEEWRRQWPLRRFGFHGLSHAYAARRAAELVGREADDRLRVVSCHLGAGASLCASRGLRSVDTTMGFTPLEGLVMATRAGSVDPGLVLWLVTEAGLTPDEVRDRLEHDSGLAGLTGTADMRLVVERRQAGDAAASLAFDVYVHALCRAVAGMTAALGGLDVLVFTGGVGEHAVEVRAAAAERFGYLGVSLDAGRNAESGGSDRSIGAEDAAVATLVIEAREDLEIARQLSEIAPGLVV